MKKKRTFGETLNNMNPTPVDAYTHTPTHEYTHTPTPTVKERKTRRVQLLMKESTVDALDAYAKSHDTSRNEIIQNLVEQFLTDKN